MTFATIIFFSSLILLAALLAEKNRELSSGKLSFFGRACRAGDSLIADRILLARKSTAVWFHKSASALVHLLSHGAGKTYVFLRKRSADVRANFAEAIREKRQFGAERAATSMFLRSVLEHKTRLREER